MGDAADDQDDDDDEDPRLRAAWAAYRADDPGEGERHARAYVEEHPDHGAGWYALACCLERAERFGAADRCFRSAAKAKRGARTTPYRCSWRRFGQIVLDAREALGAELRAALDELEVILADYADPALLEGFEDSEILGLFIGPERAERAAVGDDPDLIPRIFLFRRAHEHACREADEFAEEVRRTLYHEFGHYLGFGEDGVGRLGLD